MSIETKNLSVAYNECHLIKGISIKFESSQITSIIGPNGCGKSTLLNSLGANLLGHNGQIFVDGRDFCIVNSSFGGNCQSLTVKIRKFQNCIF